MQRPSINFLMAGFDLTTPLRKLRQYRLVDHAAKCNGPTFIGSMYLAVDLKKVHDTGRKKLKPSY
jgi:hypothetical protein